jgi:hypothetical protein
MANQIGRRCYHCGSFKSIFKWKKEGKEYLKCGSCDKSFIYYPSSPILLSNKRYTAVERIAKEKENDKPNKLAENS